MLEECAVSLSAILRLTASTDMSGNGILNVIAELHISQDYIFVLTLEADSHGFQYQLFSVFINSVMICRILSSEGMKNKCIKMLISTVTLANFLIHICTNKRYISSQAFLKLECKPTPVMYTMIPEMSRKVKYVAL